MAGKGAAIAHKIPGFGAILAFTDVRRWVSLMRRIGVERATLGFHAEADALKGLMKEIGFRKWAKFWHYGRTQISLQVRLFVEQVYSDLGKPWSDMITGFGPLTEVIISPDVLMKERAARRKQLNAQLLRTRSRKNDL